MKGLIKYDPEDVVPITMSVLLYIVDGLLTLVYSIALQGPYKDLKEQGADHRDIGSESCQLINLLDDELTHVICDLINCCNESIRSIQNVYLLNPEDVYTDPRIRELTTDFYWEVVWYADEEESLEGYYTLLSCFLYSQQQLFCYLAQLVEHHEMEYEPIGVDNTFDVHEELGRLEDMKSEDFTLLEIRNLLAKVIYCNKWMEEYF